MKLRRRKGATLGLVAVCVLVLAIIGFGFFFLSKIMGGGREVANATDAGALNVAKLALTQVNEPGAQDFQGLGVDANGVPTGNSATPITLLSYNRAVGQALIVALNAQQIGPASYGNANLVIQELRDLGLALQNKLRQGGPLNGYFTNLAGVNNVKMMGAGSNVNVANDVTSAYINPNGQGKTNIYLNTAVLTDAPAAGGLGIPAGQVTPLVQTNGLSSKGGWPQGGGTNSLAGQPYIKGYTPLTIPNMSNIVGAVVLPQNKPHLVNLGEFQSATTPVDYAPPNSWRANSTSQETSKTGNWAGAVACAIVGTLGAEYEAAIPRGYIRLRNFQSAEVANGTSEPVSNIDGSNSIFNNELYMGAADPVSAGPIHNANGGRLFTNDGRDPGGQQIQKWIDYNLSVNSLPVGDPNRDSDGKDSTKDPLGPFMSAGNPNPPPGTPQQVSDSAVPPGSEIRSHDGTTTSANQKATLAELKTITSMDWCETQDYGPTVRNPCTDANKDLWEINYGRGGAAGSIPAPASNTYTNLELMKGKLIDQWGNRCGSVNSPGAPSGMKVYNRGAGYNTHRVNTRFGSIGTPYALLQHVDQGQGTPCATDSIVNAIWQRMREINQACTRADAVTALNTFPMPPAGTNPNVGDGSYQYIYSNGPGQKPTVHLNPPPWAGGAASQIAEGSPAPCNSTRDRPVGEIINAARGAGGNPKGDINIHDVMWQNTVNENIEAWDTADWRPSCGYRNFLGEVTFKNNTSGGGTFCKPN